VHRFPVVNSTAYLPRVLVIDADATTCQDIRALLEPYGYECQSAGDGRSGLSRVEEGGWDLVLAALAVPELAGCDIVTAIQRRAPTMPIVLMANRSDPEIGSEDRPKRIPVIRKPFPPRTLTAAVVEALFTTSA
jgi:DNA-binding response OmpR family regulator